LDVGLGTQVAALHSFTDAWLSSPVYANTETTVSFDTERPGLRPREEVETASQFWFAPPDFAQ